MLHRRSNELHREGFERQEYAGYLRVAEFSAHTPTRMGRGHMKMSLQAGSYIVKSERGGPLARGITEDHSVTYNRAY
jgi:hypothetical protein